MAMNITEYITGLTQDQFIEKRNKQGIRSLSAIDIYRFPENKQYKDIENFKRDCNESYFETGDRIKYQEKGNKGTIIHNYNSTVVKPAKTTIAIPVLSYASLDDVLETEIGLKLVQSIFKTRHNSKKIKENVYILSDKSADKTKISTPDQDSRKDYPERAVFFYFDVGDFHVVGDDRVDNYDGRSRGVSLIAEGAKNFSDSSLEKLLKKEEITKEELNKAIKLYKEVNELFSKR